MDSTGIKERGRKQLRLVKKNALIISMVIPTIVLLIIFVYVPMAGNVVAFKEYSFKKGIWGSDWVGLKYFERLWAMKPFWNAFRNQLIISFAKLLTGFPAPIILALLLNEVRGKKTKHLMQTTLSFPYFLSWIVLSGIIVSFLTDQGMVNQLLQVFGLPKNSILKDGGQFRAMLYVTDIWKNMGYNSILFLAALAGINPELYEAAALDGANRWQQMLHVTWPGLASTAAVLLVLTVGSIMSGGFDQILNLENVMVRSYSDIIDTYIYREYLSKGSQLSLSAAVGLFKAVINITMVLLANVAVKKMGQEGVL